MVVKKAVVFLSFIAGAAVGAGAIIFLNNFSGSVPESMENLPRTEILKLIQDKLGLGPTYRNAIDTHINWIIRNQTYCTGACQPLFKDPAFWDKFRAKKKPELKQIEIEINKYYLDRYGSLSFEDLEEVLAFFYSPVGRNASRVWQDIGGSIDDFFAVKLGAQIGDLADDFAKEVQASQVKPSKAPEVSPSPNHSP